MASYVVVVVDELPRDGRKESSGGDVQVSPEQANKWAQISYLLIGSLLLASETKQAVNFAAALILTVAKARLRTGRPTN